ncbi:MULTISPECIES: type I-E CRISPR-associated protein Cas6/Cse3/CasE [unclassified Halomonas]|uniref:type I-E CRISPR-associated protein Cas6/Cse3/CasE n=1 Tax=unclassified Halomonas TaxID=2609666 RepID=UPI000F5E1E45|nr:MULTISPECIES: type I-E CRISPR-associated protein Cas6/Cse3/CasE [unclassified Halomonas]MCJ8285274.1 type I-E CRISPR-associated protein Cas6/Cse3/CasE [Halomonas sp.]NQY70326.1 type I-E CRISPR-associated protein Cas6/Cse3/CasE [Halomonas sp.]RQW68812.1 type I-E CRISPR-associated protein Cas6/Cse3/CasE [Halomonas sp. YLB-10]
MYLSKVRLDLNQLSRERLFAIMEGNAYSAHKLLWELFADDDETRDFLFRQELEEGESPTAIKGLPLFYVLSRRLPKTSLAHLEVTTQAFSPRLSVGQTLAFRLRANPTVARCGNGEGRSHRCDVLMDAKRRFAKEQRSSTQCIEAMDQAARDWLLKRVDRLGVDIDTDTLAAGSYRQHLFYKTPDGKEKRGREVRFSSVDYEGRLTVTDPERLLETLSQGLGRAKGFGCGMLMVRPA